VAHGRKEKEARSRKAKEARSRKPRGGGLGSWPHFPRCHLPCCSDRSSHCPCRQGAVELVAPQLWDHHAWSDQDWLVAASGGWLPKKPEVVGGTVEPC